MVEPITAGQFRAAAGVEDWQVDATAAVATFGTASFATGVALVNRIAKLAEDANHHPDVDLRYTTLTVRLTTHQVEALTERDVALARQISRAARDLGISVVPA
ncbi:4a-hydroxytetrahydrobiopterin dehydratase [Nocardioides massiliensis]|uniref:Putative pterin-4-alpha-carbinolamine dehydratase n=1 Tax=Nocardioides massiliensis TaxID=1325935 RepID=A0ABT9NJH0_9ACTN|nr:4a-hydroxytetrahydrobiopterin dehydratase [Nocardioides massiliensis]MDP9820568.1 4a-hydroxytetrahydrobiopterin dehydratase [Nocardioides massiliensis]